MGKPEQVRLSDHERQMAIELGDGILAKGLRVALQLAFAAPAKSAKGSVAKPGELLMSKQDAATAGQLGNGDVALGLQIAMDATRLLGCEAIRKLSRHGTNH